MCDPFAYWQSKTLPGDKPEGECVLLVSLFVRPVGRDCRNVACAALALCAALAAPPADAESPRWGQGYLGLSLGYAGAGDDEVGLNPPGTVVGTLDNSGALVGVIAGLRHSAGGLAYGLEIEGQIADVTDSVSSSGIVAQTRMGRTIGLKALLGLQTEKALYYVTGGPTHGWFDYSVAGGGVAIDQSFSRTGYSLGLGWERWLSERLSLRGEYLYSSFGSATFTDPVSGGATKATPVNHRLGLALIGRF